MEASSRARNPLTASIEEEVEKETLGEVADDAETLARELEAEYVAETFLPTEEFDNSTFESGDVFCSEFVADVLPGIVGFLVFHRVRLFEIP